MTESLAILDPLDAALTAYEQLGEIDQLAFRKIIARTPGAIAAPVAKKRGRPKGSKNKPRVEAVPDGE